MPLKDTLNRLREQEKQEKQEKQDRPALIAGWQGAVDALLTQIRNYLSEYEQDGSLVIKQRHMRLTEEILGSYEIGAMDIQAGPVLVLVKPVGLIVAGAEGRVDMHRQGRPSDRIMLLHMPLSGPAYPPTWCIQFPPHLTARLDPSRPTLPGTREVTPLDKESLEIAIEFLLKLM